MALTQGTRLGSFEILSLLGAGGMGEVYRAKDLKLGRDVAIKVLPGELVPRIFNYYTKSGSPCVSSVRWAKRAIDSRIWSADLVHLNGFGSSLWASR